MPPRKKDAGKGDTPDLDDLISVGEAAELLGVSHWTVRRWVARGQLTGYSLGPRHMRVSRGELRGLIRRIPAAGDTS